MATAVFGTAARAAPDRLLVCGKSGASRDNRRLYRRYASNTVTHYSITLLLPASCLPVITAHDVPGAPGDVGVIPDRACAICTIRAS